MTSAEPIEIVEFSRVEANSRTCLMRIAFRAPETEPVDEPALIIHTGQGSRRLVALPSPPSSGPDQRVAFAVARELLDTSQALSLEVGDRRIDLPEPTLSRLAASAALAEVGGEFDRLGRQSERLARLQAELRELRTSHAHLQELLELEQSGRSPLEAENAELRRRLEVADAHAAESQRVLNERCAQLERQLTAANLELQAVAEAEQASAREARGLRGQLEAAQARLRALGETAP